MILHLLWFLVLPPIILFNIKVDTVFQVFPNSNIVITQYVIITYQTNYKCPFIQVFEVFKLSDINNFDLYKLYIITDFCIIKPYCLIKAYLI